MAKLTYCTPASLDGDIADAGTKIGRNQTRMSLRSSPVACGHPRISMDQDIRDGGDCYPAKAGGRQGTATICPARPIMIPAGV